MGASNNTPYTVAAWSIEVKDKPNCFIPSPDKKYVAIGYGRKEIMLYSWVDKKPIHFFEGCSYAMLSSRIIRPAWSPDSQFLAYRWQEGIRVMDVNNFELVKVIDNQSKPIEFMFSPNGRFISVGAEDDLINIFDLTKDSSVCLVGSIKARVSQHTQRSQHSFYKLAIVPQWSADSQFILSRWNKDTQVHQVTEQEIIEQPPLSGKNDVSDISFSPDGTKVLIGVGRNNSDLWDFQKRIRIQELQSCTRSITNETTIHNTWSPNGELYAVRWEKDVLIYNTSNNTVYATFSLPWNPISMQWSPDGVHMAMATHDDIWVSNIQSKQLIHRFEALGFCDYSTSNIEPQWMDNQTVIGRYNQMVRVWDITVPSPTPDK